MRFRGKKAHFLSVCVLFRRKDLHGWPIFYNFAVEETCFYGNKTPLTTHKTKVKHYEKDNFSAHCSIQFESVGQDGAEGVGNELCAHSVAALRGQRPAGRCHQRVLQGRFPGNVLHRLCRRIAEAAHQNGQHLHAVLADEGFLRRDHRKARGGGAHQPGRSRIEVPS